MRIKGILTGENRGYARHSVEALLQVKTKQQGSEPVTEILLLRADVADNGNFELESKDEYRTDESAEFTVRAPSGARLALVSVNIEEQPIKIAVKPQGAVSLEVESDSFAASLGPYSVSIRIQDPTAPERVHNQPVTVWGKAQEDNDASEPPRTILGAAYTDKRGIVVIDVPRKAYKQLEVEVPAALSGASATPLALDETGQPEYLEVAIAVSLPPPLEDDANDEDDETCECESTDTPRTPGHAELVGSDGLYATDLGGGTCPSPAIPNRTLEEYRFYSLVRTTDPKLFGKRKKRKPLSDIAVSLAGELAYGVAALDARLVPRQSEVSDFNTSATNTAKDLDKLRLSSEAYRNSGLISARAWRDTGDIENAQKAIMERADALSEDVLREALSDPDGFTPMTLMTAERHAAFESLDIKLSGSSSDTGGRKPVSQGNMPKWDASPKTYQAATIAHGHVLEWRQVWRADGYSLGDLLYSLPLAPGQKRQIVVLDWDRDERGIRSESRTFSESFSADMAHDRAVGEIVNSTLTESIRAGSKTNTWGAGGGIGLGIPFSGGFFGLGVAGGGGGSSSSAWQNSARSLGASSSQQLAERTQQASSAVRSQRATVVVGQEQSESVSVTSEVVANYNHCHALTIEYFEVLKHYRVDQELANVSECFFVPLRMTRFGGMKALRWRDILEVYLRDRSLRSGFNAIERIVSGYADTDLPLGRYADETVRELSGKFRIELNIARPRELREDEDIQTYLDTNWNFWEQFFGPGTAQSAYDSSIDDQEMATQIFADELAPQVARAFVSNMTLTLHIDRGGASPTTETLTDVDFTMVSDYRAGREHLISFRSGTSNLAPFSRAQVVGVELGTNEELAPGSTTILRYAQVDYLNDFRTFSMIRHRRMRNDVNKNDLAYMSTLTLSRAEEYDPRARDLMLRDGLLKHLNEFVEHYHQVIWWRMDPNRRFMLLDGFIAPNSGNRSVASVTENRLLSIIGNCLVLPVAPGFQLDPTVRDAERDDVSIDLVEAYRPVIPIPPKRISLPTRGVHAEAIMGECNSCEFIDHTRFWDWESEPTGDEPTEILATSTASRRQEPADTSPSDFAAPVVAIQNTPAAPAPTGLSEITGLLSQKDLFKDVTGLEQNQANALGSFQRAMQTANYFGKLAAAGAKASHANREGERVVQKLEEAEESGLINNDDAKAVAGKLFGVMNTDLGGAEKALPTENSVMESLKKFLGGAGKKTLEVIQGKGNESQSVNATFENGEVKSEEKDEINVIIDDVAPVHQVQSLGCWAASVTMLRSYQRKQSLAIETVLEEVGAPYPTNYSDNDGMQPGEVSDFMNAFGLNDATVGALNPESLSEKLKSLGPLWIVVDEDPTTNFSVHARVITGIKGDGSTRGTMVIYNDPATGSEKEETFEQFVSKSNQLSKGLNSSFGGYSPTILSL